jgi:hypothetical protein
MGVLLEEQFVLQASLLKPKQTEDLFNMQTAIYLTVAAVAVAAVIVAFFAKEDADEAFVSLA